MLLRTLWRCHLGVIIAKDVKNYKCVCVVSAHVGNCCHMHVADWCRLGPANNEICCRATVTADSIRKSRLPRCQATYPGHFSQQVPLLCGLYLSHGWTVWSDILISSKQWETNFTVSTLLHVIIGVILCCWYFTLNRPIGCDSLHEVSNSMCANFPSKPQVNHINLSHCLTLLANLLP